MAGPLEGLSVVEFAGVGPAPYAGMILADLGATVTKIDRIRASDRRATDARANFLDRGKRSLCADLKAAEAQRVVRQIIAGSDVLIEGFRPGVMERLNLGPRECASLNPALIYGRVTGWGQEGPLAHTAGHDITYLSLTGALWAIGRAGDRPVPPLNLLGDFAGGALFVVVGVLAALFDLQSSGRGQVVDAAMVDGVASLTTWVRAMRTVGAWTDSRGANSVDSGLPHYDVYECADGKFLSIGALEPRFYGELVRLTGFTGGDRRDVASRERHRQQWAELFRSRTRDEWVSILDGSDACAAPVLDWEEAPLHPHMAARKSFVERDGYIQPAPAPRFSRSRPETTAVPPRPGAGTRQVLGEIGYSDESISALLETGALAGPTVG